MGWKKFFFICLFNEEKSFLWSTTKQTQDQTAERDRAGTVEAETTRHRRNPVVAINKSERAAGTAVNSEDEDNSCRRSRTDEDIKWRPTSVNSVAAHVHPKRPGISFLPEMKKRREEENRLTDRRIAISASYHTAAAAFARCCGTIYCKLRQIKFKKKFRSNVQQ